MFTASVRLRSLLSLSSDDYLMACPTLLYFLLGSFSLLVLLYFRIRMYQMNVKMHLYDI